MLYPINQRAHQFNSVQSVPVSFGLWDMALKFPSPGPHNDATDHLEVSCEVLNLFTVLLPPCNGETLRMHTFSLSRVVFQSV